MKITACRAKAPQRKPQFTRKKQQKTPNYVFKYLQNRLIEKYECSQIIESRTINTKNIVHNAYSTTIVQVNKILENGTKLL